MHKNIFYYDAKQTAQTQYYALSRLMHILSVTVGWRVPGSGVYPVFYSGWRRTNGWFEEFSKEHVPVILYRRIQFCNKSDRFRGPSRAPPPPLGDVLTPSLAHMFARLMLNCDRSVVKFRIFKMIAGTSGFLTAFGCTKFVLGRDSAPGQLEELS